MRRSEAPQRARLTAGGVVFGTVGYLAPETALGMDAVDERVRPLRARRHPLRDARRAPPFDATEAGPLFLAHRMQPPPPMAERAPGSVVPPEVEAIVQRLLAKAPSQRQEGAAELARALREARAALPSARGDAARGIEESPEPPPTAKPPSLVPARRPARRWPWLLSFAALAAGAVIALRLGAREAASGAPPSVPRPAVTAEVASPAPTTAPTQVAGAQASGAPSAEAAAGAAAPTEVAGIDAAGWRNVLRRAVEKKSYHLGADAIVALATLDPAAFQRADVVEAAAAVAVGIEFGDPTAAARVFDTLPKLGGPGADVLYEVTSRYGGSKGARRAAEQLRRPELVAQASPALRMAIALREAPCDGKSALYERAVAEGDERTLALLWAMRTPRCDSTRGECCIRGDAKLEQAVKSLRDRLEN